VLVARRELGAHPAALVLVRPADAVVLARMVRERLPQRLRRAWRRA
jgi:hypothetical protein